MSALADELDTSELDFVVLMGDHLEEGTERSLEAMRKRLVPISVPVVVIPGEDDLAESSRGAFRRRFGETELAWSLGGVDFVTFDSANGTLGEGGVEGLQRRLRRPSSIDSTLVVLSHIPPLPRNEYGGGGLNSQFEAARLLSVLGEFDADLLLAGHASAFAKREVGGLRLRSAGPFDPSKQGWYLVVEAGASGEVSVERKTLR